MVEMMCFRINVLRWPSKKDNNREMTSSYDNEKKMRKYFEIQDEFHGFGIRFTLVH